MGDGVETVAAALHTTNGHGTGPLRLYAPPGSPADQVLTLVGLAHHTTDPDEPAAEPGEPNASGFDR